MSETPKHTPGPWEYLQADGVVVTQASDWGAHEIAWSDADFVLIAAAPDMLAAVKDYLEWGAMTGSDRELFASKFRDVIAKAEGRL